jgi:hypothetical protein
MLGLALGALLGLPCVAVFLWIVRSSGETFYLYVWLFIMMVQLVMVGDAYV